MTLATVPWWRWLLSGAAWWFGVLMMLCAYHWPRSSAPGVELVRDIVIPFGFALLGGAALITGFALL
jgi:hypothetical protein